MGHPFKTRRGMVKEQMRAQHIWDDYHKNGMSVPQLVEKYHASVNFIKNTVSKVPNTTYVKKFHGPK